MKYLLMFALLLGRLCAQTYQPTWDSVDKRPTPQWYVDGAKSVPLLGSIATLKFKNAGKDLSIQLPALPEDLRHQPAWVLKIGR